ncbi:NADH dehydrogenase [ubiquinone] 1 alpha subcomplex subunit 6-like [Toxorhynchites rutilus septentrionalis]|uniref:NADH dehydrogenase [ubiquinone] 1 alpha subcomplex subunit 6-like n=1 Tax=Toxorhynchites rutilus septentrionalis TaxID=329112 RepID=UPI0024786FC4|nr:NADH dehydrogenase [ubiquinone] 1 alpha subcomplex subunit 6-like [Toxorhynchites rutilus septentrionalis]
MASSGPVKQAVNRVRPLLSIDHQEARRNVIKLYKTWYRHIPLVVHQYDIPKTVGECRLKLREQFDKHKDVTDVRVIDMLVIKEQMELKAIVNRWKQKSHLMRYWQDGCNPKPKGFLERFYAGHE